MPVQVLRQVRSCNVAGIGKGEVVPMYAMMVYKGGGRDFRHTADLILSLGTICT